MGTFLLVARGYTLSDVQPSDLSKLVTPSDPRIHGDRVVFVLTSIDLDEDRYVREIWIHDGSGARRLTGGPADSAPRWSPDGSRLAFLRSRDSKPAQVAVIPVDGGEAAAITDFDLGVEELEWSPDGSRLAVTAITWHDDWADLDDDERAGRPRRVTSIPYRFDQMGWTHDRKRHIWLVDPEGVAEPDCVTPGPHDDRNLAWSPDGSALAFVSDRHARQGLAAGTDVWEVAIAGDRVPIRRAERGFWTMPGYRPDGVLHLIGHTDPMFPQVFGVYRVESDRGLTGLTAPVDRAVASLAGGPPQMRWRGRTLYCYVEDAGSVNVLRVEPDGSTEVAIGGRRVVGSFDVSEDRIVFTASSPVEPGTLLEWIEGGESELESIRSDVELVEPRHFRSGTHDVDTWVVMPPGDGRVPVLLNIHGGPASQYGDGFFDEFQVYAAAGFGVVACNPRGSSGRGEEFLKAVTADGWGVVDVEDVLVALDAALEANPRLDPGRIGIMGGSYGGFLTAWILGHHDRFRSAVVERGLLNWTSFSGTSDIAGVFAESYLGAGYPEGWRTWWERSPLAVVDRVTTPTLVLHAESDLRCPIEQAEQYFTALLRNGTPTEMVRFPGEGHEMSRSGKPRHRVERFEAILEWHRRWLGTGSDI